MSNLIKVIIFIFILSQNLQACRLWAICTKSNFSLSTISESDRLEVENQLNTFYQQSSSMLNGWSLLCYSDAEQDSVFPVYRSDIPANIDSLNYWSSVETMLSTDQARIGLGHLRLASSGSNSIPNPHPWMFYMNNYSFSLIHNGTVNKELLYALITDNGSDTSWLYSHPPQTFGGGDWNESGWGNVVDSELILLYIMKEINVLNDMIEGFQEAINNIINAGTNANQLNIIFSDGNQLMAFGGDNRLYYKESSQHFAIMTQPPDNGDNSWEGIDYQELILVNNDSIYHYTNFIANEIDDDNPSDLYSTSFGLSPAYPNPFNGFVSFKLDNSTVGSVKILIHNIHGKEVDRFNVNASGVENQKFRWKPSSNMPSGNYFVTAKFDFNKQTRKILFIK